MQIRFDDRVALVTGAAQGIGRAIATALVEAGATVHLADIDAEGVAATAAAIGAVPHAVDLGSAEAAAKLVADIVAQSGRLELLVHAAGGVRGQVGRPIEAISEADWRVIFAANVDSAFFLAQAAAPAMKASGHGRIVTITSVVGATGNPGQINYASSKAGLIGMARSLTRELGSRSITANVVAPGFIESAMTGKLNDKQKDAIMGAIPMKRMGTGAEVASAVVYLASNEAAYMTGQTLHVNGGMAMI